MVYDALVRTLALAEKTMIDNVHTSVYTVVEVVTMTTTKVFNNGNSQAIRIPKEYRFEQDEVCVQKVGAVLMVFQPDDRFGILMNSINGFTDDFMADGRQQPPVQAREQFE